MNKKLFVALSTIAVGLGLVACDGGNTSSSKLSATPDSSTVTTDSSTVTSSAVAEASYTLKFGSYVSYSDGEADVAMAAAILDSDEKVVDVYFDVLQAPVEIDGEAVVLKSTATSVKDAGDKVIETKQELGDRYGMANIAHEGEWYEQAAAFAEYCNGQTLDAITSATYGGEDGVTVTGCSIATTNFTGALKSITDSKTFTSSVKPEAGIGTIVSYADNVITVTLAGVATTATSDTVLETSINAYLIPLAIDGEAVVIDTTKTQAKAENIASHGASDLTVVLSKREEKELYGMTGIAAAGEWYEQADAFATYCIDKSAASLDDVTYGGDDGVAVTGCTIAAAALAAAVAEGGSVLK